MQWFIASRQMQIVCTPSTDSEQSIDIWGDKELRSIETFNGSYEFDYDATHEDAQFFAAGNYVIFKDKSGKTRMYTIIDADDDGYDGHCYCEDIGLDLLNESKNEWAVSEAKPLSYYFEQILFDTGWKIRTNEVADLSRKLEWTGTNTLYKLLLSVLNSFDKAEMEFVIEVSGNFIVSQYIDIYKAEHNADQLVQKFIDSVNLKNLRRSTSIKSIITAVEGRGSQKEDKSYVTFADIVYDDGDYFSPKGESRIYSRSAKEKWSRYNIYTDPEFNSVNRTETGGHILGQFSYDTENEQELFNRTLADLKEREQLEVSYEAEVVDLEAAAGDYVQIADNHRKPPIYLSARVLSTEVSYTTQGADTAKFGNYREVESNADLTWQDAMKQLEENIKNIPAGKDGADAVLLTVSSVNGNMFKNTGVSTILTAVITVGGTIIDTAAKMHDYFGADAYLQWQIKKIGELEFTDIPLDDSRLSDEGFMLTVNVDDVDQKATFKCDLYY